MSAEFFIDTNVLVYSFDETEPEKRVRSRQLIARALADGVGIISWQVVQEFLNVALHRWEVPMGEQDARRFIETTLQPLCQVFPDSSLWTSALQLRAQSGYRWYDSLVVASALRAGCRTLYSEDLQDGRSFGNLLIRNPYPKSK